MFAVNAAAPLLQFARQIRFRSECSPAVGTEAAAEKGTSARPAGSSQANLHRLTVHAKRRMTEAGGSLWHDSAIRCGAKV
jgi:hypothetical protein